MRTRFIAEINVHQNSFGLELPAHTVSRLADYYALILNDNPRLHLVAPSSPKDFAVRHILEPLTLLQFLPENALLADVGAGAGLPSIPCLIAQEDLRGVLIESKEKKADFLRRATKLLKMNDRTRIVNRQFEEVPPDDSDHVTCRALDKFIIKLPRLLKWAGKRKLLLFGGPGLEEALVGQRQKIVSRLLMPLSEQRFLFVVDQA